MNLNSSPPKRPPLDPIQLALKRRAQRYSVARLPAPSDSLTAERDAVVLDASGRDLVAEALAARGIRYRWGGANRGGFDCSGFTRYLFARLHGIKLPHSASRQAQYGRKVPRDGLQEGDLVFFRTNRRGISHVGIYIGENKFIHAANRRKHVRVDSLTGYYSRRYVTARRLLPRAGPPATPIAKPPAPEAPAFSLVAEPPEEHPAELPALKLDPVSLEISVSHGETTSAPRASASATEKDAGS